MFAQAGVTRCDHYGGVMVVETALLGRWLELCERASIERSAAELCGDRLLAAHKEPHRHYHDLTHLSECFDLVDAMDDLGAEDRNVVGFTIWFHDAVYAPTASDNEAVSAAMAVAWLDEAGYPLSGEVSRLIEATAGHELPRSDDLVGAAVHDADLAILGADPPRYIEYSMQIRQEYGHLPDEQYRVGRCAVLASFLATSRIYARSDIRQGREDQARQNMARELRELDL